MIIIKDILLYYYDINILNYKCDFNNNYFIYNNAYYLLKEVGQYDISFISNIENITIISFIIKNKYNEIISNYENKKYALIKVKISGHNKPMNINDLLFISNINYYIPSFKINFYELWSKKVDYIESYYNNYCLENIDNNYFICLSTIAINLIKNINFNNVTYRLTYKRFYNIDTLYDMLDPFNIKYGPVVNGIAEYIKYSYFSKKEKVEYKDILSMKLNLEDYILFVARLIFPTYYFDLLNKEDMPISDIQITCNIDEYLEYVKEIINTIKKRYIKLSFLENIINQL